MGFSRPFIRIGPPFQFYNPAKQGHATQMDELKGFGQSNAKRTLSIAIHT